MQSVRVGAMSDHEVQSLPFEHARQIAVAAMELDDRNLRAKELRRLSCLVPGVLRGLHGELIRRGIDYPPELFLGADAQARDSLLKSLPAHQPPHLTLTALAWIGDEVVQREFARWRQSCPSWIEEAADIDRYTFAAGWELAPEGSRRDLFWDTSYHLIPQDSLCPNVQEVGPVKVGGELASRCTRCGRPLEVALSLDLRDPTLTFFNFAGTCLVIAVCQDCGLSGPCFTSVDWKGASKSLGSPPPSREELEVDLPRLPIGCWHLGPKRRWAYEASELAETELSQIGGYPAWVGGSAEYPACPQCNRSMRFVGQFHGCDAGGILFPRFPEGTTLCFVCIQCQTAATVYQQT